MKETFDQVYPDLMKSEGHYVNDPRDPGGATNLGVTLGTAKAYHIDVDHDGDTDVQDIKLLTPELAKPVYKSAYWNKVGGDLLPAGLDYSVFDFGVNSGPATAVKHLQKVVGVAADGVVGNQTLAAVAEYSLGIAALIDEYSQERLRFLRGLNTWGTFGTGWTNRVNRVDDESKKIANGSIAPVGHPIDTPKVPDGLLRVLVDVVLGLIRKVLFHG